MTYKVTLNSVAAELIKENLTLFLLSERLQEKYIHKFDLPKYMLDGDIKYINNLCIDNSFKSFNRDSGLRS